MALQLSMVEEKDVSTVATLADRPPRGRPAEGGHQAQGRRYSGGRRFMTQQLCRHRSQPLAGPSVCQRPPGCTSERRLTNKIANNFVFMIEELRRHLEHESDRLAEQVFRSLLEKNQLRFLIIGDDLAWTFPKKIAVKRTARRLTRKDQSPLQLEKLFDLVPEDFNETEKRRGVVPGGARSGYSSGTATGPPRLCHPGLAAAQDLSGLHLHNDR